MKKKSTKTERIKLPYYIVKAAIKSIEEGAKKAFIPICGLYDIDGVEVYHEYPVKLELWCYTPKNQVVKEVKNGK